MLIIEAGCKKKEWEFENGIPYQYHWVSAGKLLAEGVCIDDNYLKYIVPKNGLKVNTTIEYQNVRDVGEKKKTVSIDLTLTIRWIDPRIKWSKKYLNRNRVTRDLSPTAIEMIWIPDMDIKNLTAYKFREEWISRISSKISIPEATNNMNTDTTVEMRYGIKATVYCKFDHSRYPMDKQSCNVNIGSKSASAKFVLDRNDDKYHRSENYEAVNFDMAITFFDESQEDGSNTVGLNIKMVRIKTSYIFTYYVPCIAIVLVSGISFVIPVTPNPGRVALLVTQFLTLINLFIHENVSKGLKVERSKLCTTIYSA